MVELLSVQKVILYDGQERTRSAPAQAQLDRKSTRLNSSHIH